MSVPVIAHPSANFDPRPDGVCIDILVLHYTGMQSGADALARLCDPEAKVSAHYLIEEDGRIFQLVAEADRAWHAGVASWRGATDINDRSIGIELVNPGHEFGYRPFPEPQMAALINLAGDVVARHDMGARNVVGHSDVAPARKQDPGELFDWRRLADAGVGIWPETPGDRAKIMDATDAPMLLSDIGYDVDDVGLAVTAFQRRYLPHRVNGRIDQDVVDRLVAVAALI